MTFIPIRSTVILVLVHVLLTAGAGCVSMTMWPKPIAGDETPRPWPRPDYPGEMDLDQIRESLLQFHNQVRIEKKKPRVRINRILQEAAQAHAVDMAARRKMTHEGADGSTAADRVKALGYGYRRCGENIAFGHYTPELVMRGWLTSPPHRKNILGAYSQIGLGYATDKDGTPYWCVTFGTPSGR